MSYINISNPSNYTFDDKYNADHGASHQGNNNVQPQNPQNQPQNQPENSFQFLEPPSNIYSNNLNETSKFHNSSKESNEMSNGNQIIPNENEVNQVSNGKKEDKKEQKEIVFQNKNSSNNGDKQKQDYANTKKWMFKFILNKLEELPGPNPQVNFPQNIQVHAPFQNIIQSQNNQVNVPQNNQVNVPQNNQVNAPQNIQVNAPQNSRMDVQHNYVQMSAAPQYNQQMNAPENPKTYMQSQNIQINIQQTDENIFQQKLRQLLIINTKKTIESLEKEEKLQKEFKQNKIKQNIEQKEQQNNINSNQNKEKQFQEQNNFDKFSDSFESQDFEFAPGVNNIAQTNNLIASMLFLSTSEQKESNKEFKETMKKMFARQDETINVIKSMLEKQEDNSKIIKNMLGKQEVMLQSQNALLQEIKNIKISVAKGNDNKQP